MSDSLFLILMLPLSNKFTETMLAFIYHYQKGGYSSSENKKVAVATKLKVESPGTIFLISLDGMFLDI